MSTRTVPHLTIKLVNLETLTIIIFKYFSIISIVFSFLFFFQEKEKLVIKSYHWYTNKGVGVLVEVHYDSKEDLDLIPRENSTWEGKPDYVRRRLVSFPGNKERGYP